MGDTPPPPTTPGGLKNWALLGAGFALGFAISKALLRLDDKIRALLASIKVSGDSLQWTAYLLAIAVYLALAVALWHKDGAIGYFGAGFFAGALVETALMVPSVKGV